MNNGHDVSWSALFQIMAWQHRTGEWFSFTKCIGSPRAKRQLSPTSCRRKICPLWEIPVLLNYSCLHDYAIIAMVMCLSHGSYRSCLKLFMIRNFSNKTCSGGRLHEKTTVRRFQRSFLFWDTFRPLRKQRFEWSTITHESINPSPPCEWMSTLE